MRRGARSGIAAMFGVLWGLGVAVLLQQFGVVPLDPPSVYGIPLAAALLSGARAWVRRRPAAPASLGVVALFIPLSFLSLQSADCGIVLDDSRSLSDTSFNNPFEIGQDAEELKISIREPVAGAQARAWVEIGAFQVWSGPIPAGQTTHIVDRNNSPVGAALGLYRVGVNIDDVCSEDGYIRVAGNPLVNPAGQAASAALVVGLLGAWWAGRSPRGDGHIPDDEPNDQSDEPLSPVSARSVAGPPSVELDLPSDEPIGHTVRFEPTVDTGTHDLEEFDT